MIEPVLGYPSRTAAIEAMLAQGQTVEAITEAIGGTRNSVQVLIAASARRIGDRRFILPRQAVVALRDEAARRGTNSQHLAQQLLERIWEDDLFDALLGEAPEPEDATDGES